MITYIRIGEMPYCNNCKKQLDYYYPYLPDEEHICDACISKNISIKLTQFFEKELERIKSEMKKT